MQGEVYSVLSDIWSLGVSLIEMAIGCFPIPEPSPEQVAEEMKLPPAGILPPRRNPHASHANAVRMPIFELLQIIFQNVSSLQFFVCHTATQLRNGTISLSLTKDRQSLEIPLRNAH